jgi:3'-phosphoadenosine 5'-phosphosulfate sulfotransferase (PAPS reductase)/FAD synthetase
MLSMSFSLELAENGALTIGCAILALAVAVFFVILYAIDFKEGRQKAKKRREYERTLKRARSRKQNRAGGNVLSRNS